MTFPPAPPFPTSTYRVQFGPQFGFVDALRIVPYLDALGVGYLYASPYFRARPGSQHGYDVVDHNALNPEIGDTAEHRALCAALRERGLGQLVDFVPNHMGIGDENPWWHDVLEFGQLSPFAHYFDIDWHARAGNGRVVLPVLGDHYGQIIERGEITLAFDAAAGTFALRYFNHAFPLAPASYGRVLTFAADTAAAEPAQRLRLLAAEFTALRGRPRDAARRAALRARAGDQQRALAAAVAHDPALQRAIEEAGAEFPTDPDRIDALLDAQAYRLAFWRVASDEINYRRFFDINDLAGLRVEDAEVLARTHELVFSMIEDARINGLRIDHVDGLANPGGYCNLLADRAAALGHPLYLVVEKILLGDERLRPGWRIAGTTGYDFLNLVTGLFVDRELERGFDRLYTRAIGRTSTFAEEADTAKRRVMRVDLASELQVLAEMLTRIAHRDRRSKDFTTIALRRALADTIAAFPVYRTYLVSEAIEAEDQEVIDLAIAAAQALRELPDGGVYDFLRDALSVHLLSDPARHYERVELLRFVLRFQQYTGPVTAKSLEDTAFYRYVRLVALNEVGGEPARFGRSVAEFHAANGERAAHHPHAMLATATHDHKRGEDTRLRIAALTEFPSEWSRALSRWARLNAAAREVAVGAPTPVDEFLFYQTVVGTLPAEWLAAAPPAPDAHASYVDRLVAYARKAAREAKLRTNWTDPNEGYERGLESFVRTALATDSAFLPDALAFTRALAPVAAVHGLAQLALKLTAPGVPDVYQGCELWDFSLVDPDNRRPVDYQARAAMLADFSTAPDAERLVDELLAHWTDGGIKLFVTWRLLRLRRDAPHWFVSSAYAPLQVEGAPPESTIAFRRGGMVVVVPRLVRRRLDGMRVRFPAASLDLGAPGRRYRHALDGRLMSADGLGRIALDAAFANVPVAVLLPED